MPLVFLQAEVKRILTGVPQRGDWEKVHAELLPANLTSDQLELLPGFGILANLSIAAIYHKQTQFIPAPYLQQLQLHPLALDDIFRQTSPKTVKKFVRGLQGEAIDTRELQLTPAWQLLAQGKIVEGSISTTVDRGLTHLLPDEQFNELVAQWEKLLHRLASGYTYLYAKTIDLDRLVPHYQTLRNHYEVNYRTSEAIDRVLLELAKRYLRLYKHRPQITP